MSVAFYGEDEEDSYSYSESESPSESAAKPEAESKPADVSASEATAEKAHEKVDEDLVRLLQVAMDQLESINSSVVLAAASLLLHLAPEDTSFVTKSVSAMVHLLNRNPRYSFFVLDSIDELSALYPDYFQPWIEVFFLSSSHPQWFFPRVSEPGFVISQKTRILCRLINEESVAQVLKALQPFAVHPSSDVVVNLIQVSVSPLSHKDPSGHRAAPRAVRSALSSRVRAAAGGPIERRCDRARELDGHRPSAAHSGGRRQARSAALGDENGAEA